MIRRAVERGVSPERLAKALSVDVLQIMKRMALLDGICAEGLAVFAGIRASSAEDEADAASRMCRTLLEDVQKDYFYHAYPVVVLK